jgi:hypothetical protein
MLIIIDTRIPKEAKDTLRKTGNVFELDSQDIVYESIKGHPDIFLFQMSDLVIMAPNAPSDLKEILKKERIPFLVGKSKLSKTFPDTVFYNAVSTGNYLIHKKDYADSCILHQNAKKTFIDVSQAYTRCNLLSLPDGSFITSDKGIESSLQKNGIEVHYFSSDGILLEAQEHGFIGGCMGIYKHTVYLLGHLDFYTEGKRLGELLQSKGLSIVELYRGPLIDGGSIFFLNS